MVRALGLGVLLALVSVMARAADQPLYRPSPDWVRPVPIPFDMKPSGAAVDVLLSTVQDRLAPNDDEAFVEQASRIAAPEGLGQLGNLILTWNPVTETLAIHRAQIIRGGRIIDLLAGSRKFAVLRREANLEAAMIDGELTATLQPEGLQVGDVLDLAYTTVRREPALAGHSEGGAAVGHAGTIGRQFVRVAWPAGRLFQTWRTDDLPPLVPVTKAGWTEVGFDQTGAVSPDPPKGALASDQLLGLAEVSDFKDWKDVSATAYPLFAQAAALAPDSALKAEISRIRSFSPDPKARALAALKLVEDQTRYLYVSLDAGGYTPASADLTWARRFGDCKGKTVLLLALLQGLDVSAEPALVSTAFGDGLDRRIPELGTFDHVIIRARIGEQTYWLDGTREDDANLDVLPIPSFHWALPLRAEGAMLERLTPKEPVLPLAEAKLTVDARGGIDHPAKVHEELIFRGDLALAMSLGMKRASRIDAERRLRQWLTLSYSWIKPENVGWLYDPQKMEGRATLDGSGTPPFSSAEGSTKGPRDWLVASSAIGAEVNLTRTSDYHRDAPYAVNFPSYMRSFVEMDLPDSGKGFEVLNGESVNRTVAGTAYSRAAGISDGRLVMVASTRSVESSFPASEAASGEAGLRNLADYQVSVRFTPPAASGIAAADARTKPSSQAASVDPAEKAVAAFFDKDYTAAEAGFTVVLNARPSAKTYYDRAVARAALGKDALAIEDLQAALKLDPKHDFALLALGRFALRRGDAAGAATRFTAAQAASSQPGSMAAMIAGAYETTGRYADAIPYRDLVIAHAVTPNEKVRALNLGCWSRAESGTELKRALEDCDEALRLHPRASPFLDSRGLVDLRLGAFDRAVTDYTAALAERPNVPTSLFGRALAEARLGQRTQAAADLAAARAIDPKIDLTFAKWGLSP